MVSVRGMTRGIDRSVGLRWRDGDRSGLASIPPQRVVDRLWSEAPRRKGAGWRGRGRGRGGVVMLVVNVSDEQRRMEVGCGSTLGELSPTPRSRDLPDDETRRTDQVVGSLPSRLELGCRCCPTKKSLVRGQRGFHHMGLVWRRAFVPVNSQTDVSFLARTNDDDDEDNDNNE